MGKASNLKLNKDQLEAVEHTTGPLLIIAGAGTGKTTVITERIKYLITKGLAKPEEILALTFMEKAALEMEIRVDKVMPLSYGDIWITTFHSFCDRVLRKKSLHIGLPSDFKLMTTEKSVDLFKRNLFNFSLDYFRPLGNPNKFIYSLLKHFSRLQDELITPQDYILWQKENAKKTNAKSDEDELENKKWQELATVYKEYDELKLKEAKFDFGDLVIKTVELFQKRPNILLEYQNKFKYILVDEFQDTNYGQNVLVNLLAKKDKNLTVVGDDNQSIYKFRGASVDNIVSFKNVYKNAKTVTLNKNYRSTQNILDGAYRLIKHNDPDTLEFKLGISKKLVSSFDKKIEIEFINTKTGDDEASAVVDRTMELVDKYGYEYRDFAILLRANNHAESIVKEFERRGVPHQFLGPSSLFQKEEIVDLISYMKSLYDPDDTESFYRLISSNFLKIDSIEIVKLLSKSKKESMSLYELFLESDLHTKLNELFKKHLVEINIKTAGEIVFEFLKEMGIYQDIIKNEEDLKAKNISAFFQKVKTFENENPNAKLRQVVDYINLLVEVKEAPQVTNEDWQENNAVNILTAHSSKGLEFPVVFMCNLVSERFPGRNRGDDLPIPDNLVKEKLPTGDIHLQEERRLFYVGMTRAKERLYLTASDFYSDGKRKRKISPFVFEALGKIVESRMQNEVSIKQKLDYKEKSMLHTTSYILQRKIEFLSVSQIEAFKTCPLHYKLAHIYKLPSPQTASTSFGSSIHETLKEFYTTGGDILKIFKKSFRSEGYENKKHKEKFYKKGEDYLKGFLENGFDSKIKTLELEKKFSLKISKDLKMGGTIDRIDDLGGGEYEIIDYKTGATIPTQKEVDKNLQLSVYALAVSQIYNVKPESIKLSLYYFDNQEKLTTKRTEKDLEKIEEEILEIRDEIEKSDFKCNNNYFCQKGCEYSMFCKSDTT